MSATTRSKRSVLLGILFLGCLPLQSCFTAGLWSSEISPRGKAGLTPLALTLDAVTFPAQLAILQGGRGRCR